MWDLPRPGLEPMTLALAGRFLTTAPPGKPSGLPYRHLTMPHPHPKLNSCTIRGWVWTPRHGGRKRCRGWGRQMITSQSRLIFPQPGLLVGKQPGLGSILIYLVSWLLLQVQPSASGPPGHPANSSQQRGWGLWNSSAASDSKWLLPSSCPDLKKQVSPGARLGPESRSTLDVLKNLWHFKRLLFFKRITHVLWMNLTSGPRGVRESKLFFPWKLQGFVVVVFL